MPTRRPGTVLLASLIAAPLAALAASVVAPEWVRRAGLDVWNLPAQEQKLRAAREQERDLRAKGGEVIRRMAVREALIAELIAGRADLARTVADFRVLDGGRTEHLMAVQLDHPGLSDPEAAARVVIRYALIRVPGRADREQLRRRLEGECQKMFARPDESADPAGPVRVE
jgi:hypothetical protein